MHLSLIHLLKYKVLLVIYKSRKNWDRKQWSHKTAIKRHCFNFILSDRLSWIYIYSFSERRQDRLSLKEDKHMHVLQLLLNMTLTTAWCMNARIVTKISQVSCHWLFIAIKKDAIWRKKVIVIDSMVCEECFIKKNKTIVDPVHLYLSLPFLFLCKCLRQEPVTVTIH